MLLHTQWTGGSDGKESAYNVDDRFDPWVGKIPGEGNGNLP